MSEPPPPAPLAGLLVVELATTIPGPYCTSLLHDLGARVIKLEPPGGDPGRFRTFNAGKESVEVDLKSASGLALARSVISRADVLVVAWRPGVANRLGLSADLLMAENPRLVYCAISGYGSQSAHANRPGHDLNYLVSSQAWDAMRPHKAAGMLGIPLADAAAGTTAAFRIAAAVADVRGGGSGSYIDISMTACVHDWVDLIGGLSGAGDLYRFLTSLPHYGTFTTRDGEVLALGIVREDRFWEALCDALGVVRLRNLELAERIRKRRKIRRAITRRVRRLSRAEIEQRLSSADTCWSFAGDYQDASVSTGATSPTVPALNEHARLVSAEFGVARTRDS